MAQLHSYYITNSQKEIYFPDNFTENELQEAIEAAFDIENNETDNELNVEYLSSEESTADNNMDCSSSFLEIANYFNFDNAEFQQLMEVDIQVVIEPHQYITDHGEKEFDIDTLLDNTLEELE